LDLHHDMRRLALAASISVVALAAGAQARGNPKADAELDCRQLQAELTALANAEAAAQATPHMAAAAGAQVLGRAVQQSGGRRPGQGSKFGSLVDGNAPAAAAQGTAGQLQQVAQAVPGAPGVSAGHAEQARAQAAALAQVSGLRALAHARGVAGVGRNQAEAAGMVSMPGGMFSPVQAAQPVAMPGNAAIQQLAGSRQDQLGGLFLAKGCKAPT
jgi:hypothetical protein